MPCAGLSPLTELGTDDELSGVLEAIARSVRPVCGPGLASPGHLGSEAAWSENEPRCLAATRPVPPRRVRHQPGGICPNVGQVNRSACSVPTDRRCFRRQRGSRRAS